MTYKVVRENVRGGHAVETYTTAKEAIARVKQMRTYTLAAGVQRSDGKIIRRMRRETLDE